MNFLPPLPSTPVVAGAPPLQPAAGGPRPSPPRRPPRPPSPAPLLPPPPASRSGTIPAGHRRALHLAPTAVAIFAASANVAQQVSASWAAVALALAGCVLAPLRLAAASLGRGSLCPKSQAWSLCEFATLLFLPVEPVEPAGEPSRTLVALAGVALPARARATGAPAAGAAFATPKKAPARESSGCGPVPPASPLQKVLSSVPDLVGDSAGSLAPLCSAPLAVRAAVLAVVGPLVGSPVVAAWPALVRFTLWMTALEAAAQCTDALSRAVASWAAPGLDLKAGPKLALCPWTPSVAGFWDASGGSLLAAARSCVLDPLLEGRAVVSPVEEKRGSSLSAFGSAVGGFVKGAAGVLASPFKGGAKPAAEAEERAPRGMLYTALVLTFAAAGAALEVAHVAATGTPSAGPCGLAVFVAVQGLVVVGEAEVYRHLGRPCPQYHFASATVNAVLFAVASSTLVPAVEALPVLPACLMGSVAAVLAVVGVPASVLGLPAGLFAQAVSWVLGVWGVASGAVLACAVAVHDAAHGLVMTTLAILKLWALFALKKSGVMAHVVAPAAQAFARASASASVHAALARRAAARFVGPAVAIHVAAAKSAAALVSAQLSPVLAAFTGALELVAVALGPQITLALHLLDLAWSSLMAGLRLPQTMVQDLVLFTMSLVTRATPAAVSSFLLAARGFARFDVWGLALDIEDYVGPFRAVAAPLSIALHVAPFVALYQFGKVVRGALEAQPEVRKVLDKAVTMSKDVSEAAMGMVEAVVPRSRGASGMER